MVRRGHEARSPVAADVSWGVSAVVAAVVVVVLSACGTTTAPGGPRTGATTPPAPTTGPLRPFTDQPRAADGGLDCPATLASAEGMTVPERPQGLDGNARLLPVRDPESLVVCRYPVMKLMASTPLAPPFALGTRTLVPSGDRREVVDLLAWAPRGDGSPRPCTQMAGDETAYLVGARYQDAVVWVAAKADPNSCSSSTNGDFLSRAPMGVALERWFGPHPTSEPSAPGCAAWSWGRLGDDRSIAPEGDPLVTVCRTAKDGSQRPTTLTAEQSREVVAALRSLPARPTAGACQGDGGSTEHDFRLRLTYAVGPAVSVAVSPRCTPAVLAGGLEVVKADDLVALVEQSSPPIPGPDLDGSVSSTNASAPSVSG
ncbi:hypothetical protein N865_14735 [Intrasporangium oryzae NRRL B-24470]|uniref:Uncharacterized protein n=1 Tax=Intrasporangium oryzae NRRL B-24470 TaxID=1386089 RepID=W9G6W6_9MICO|nr:hypothetical protein [Intrasporangium oryzae]EWT00548.1 hypothetical protein N865_14735 [Intrasporangium oryzae NRRL B-24470]